MKPNIPPELNDLMWALAETADPDALEEFGRRHPELRAEMGKRLGMVRQLRASKPVTAPPQVAEFRWSGTPARPLLPRWAAAAAAFAVLAAIGVGSFLVVRSMNPVAPAPAPEPAPTAFVREADPSPLSVERPRDPNYNIYEPSEVPPIRNNEEGVARWKQPISLSMRQVPIQAAIRAISAQSGLTVEVAPGMPERMVDLEFELADPMKVLYELGATFGFTVFEQEPGKVLIIPETETPDVPTAEQPRGGSPPGPEKPTLRSSAGNQ